MKRKLDWLLRSKGVEIVFEDDHFIVLNKPANVLVLPDRYNHALANLYTILSEELGAIFVVHRIDKETSGLIVFAKSGQAHQGLNTQFEERTVEKVYQAIVVGTPAGGKGTINLPLAESSRHVGKMRVDHKKGKESVTEYRVVELFKGYALVEARPRTGRVHQIRVHLRSIDLPILGDKLYGDGKGFYLSQVKERYKKEGEEKPLLDRTALHAIAISFVHPISGERLHFSSRLPKDMQSVLKYLRKLQSV